ncbi:MAG: hypothetical protein NVS2B14_16450 [Chamaesiphon sp.]
MDLDRQIQFLIDDAPQDGSTPKVIAAIAPVLKLLASRLQHSEYYIFQTFAQEWVLTTLSHRAQPEVEKNVVYAFATLKDASNFQQMPDPQLIALKMPIIHLLFQLFSMDTVDSIVFFDTAGNLTSGTEVHRSEVQNLIQTQLQHNPSPSKSNANHLPPDIA